MWLIKDYRTGTKSLTITLLVITFLLSCAAMVVNIYAVCVGKPTDSSLVWAGLGMFSLPVALYFKKRFRVSATGIEFQDDSALQSGEGIDDGNKTKPGKILY